MSAADLDEWEDAVAEYYELHPEDNPNIDCPPTWITVMTRPAAIDQEREQLDLMIQLLALDIDAEPIKRERPDFILTLRNGCTVGIEIVRALDEHLAGGRGARLRLKRQIRDTLVKEGINAHINISVSDGIAAHLNTDGRALRSEIQAVVALARATLKERLAHGVQFERNEEEDAEGEHFGWVDHHWEQMMGRRRYNQRDLRDLEGTGIEHLTAISIYPAAEPRVWWSGSGPGQPPNIVQEAIDGKVEDLPIYRHCGADEIWLLVVGSTGTGGALFIEDVEDLVFTSPYDRTIFLELFERRCMVLNTRAAISSEQEINRSA